MVPPQLQFEDFVSKIIVGACAVTLIAFSIPPEASGFIQSRLGSGAALLAVAFVTSFILGAMIEEAVRVLLRRIRRTDEKTVASYQRPFWTEFALPTIASRTGLPLEKITPRECLSLAFASMTANPGANGFARLLIYSDMFGGLAIVFACFSLVSVARAAAAWLGAGEIVLHVVVALATAIVGAVFGWLCRENFQIAVRDLPYRFTVRLVGL